MTSREEIINSLNACMDVHRSGLWSSGCAFCSYAKQSNPKCYMNLTKDVIELLKEQEPVKPTVDEFGNAYCICGENVGFIPQNDKTLPKVLCNYCNECGRKLVWE